MRTPKSSRQQRLTSDEILADAISFYYADPLGHVLFSYPWDSDPSIQMVKLSPRYRDRFGCAWGPDEWACEFLDDLGREIRDRGFDGINPVKPIQFATVSGHGIGKSTIVAWLIKFIMDTRPFCKGVVTAMTSEQLRTKTWAEVGKWHRRSLTEHWFNYTSGRGAMSLTHRDYPQEWRCDAQTSREENSESFAGLHAANSTPFYVFDEASGIPEKIFEVREGGTTDGEPMIFDFGNGTRNSGRFYEECVGRFRDNFRVRSIDSRSVSITNKERFDQWVKDYGEDSDFVRVRVKGEFPKAGSLQFIGNDLTTDAFEREVKRDRYAPLVIGVDVARFGDDSTVIWPRIGDDARSFPPRQFKGLDTVQVTTRVVDVVREFRALGMECKGLFVDGGGLGAGVVDQLNNLGYVVFDVQFGGRPADTSAYRYKGDEMWGRMRDRMRDHLCLPNVGNIRQELMSQLTAREYGYTLKGQINLESKSDMKDRGLPSPDLADALCLTFAQEVAASRTPFGAQQATTVQSEYDPLNSTF
ncbi:MAG: terminase [Chloroflexi bacterium]|nr:terminase [Chloroflexota bacterium]